MKPPPDVLFHHDLRLMVWRPRGTVNEKAINKILEFMGKKETASHEPFNRFTDASLVNQSTSISDTYFMYRCSGVFPMWAGQSNRPFSLPGKSYFTTANCIRFSLRVPQSRFASSRSAPTRRSGSASPSRRWNNDLTVMKLSETRKPNG